MKWKRRPLADGTNPKSKIQNPKPETGLPSYERAADVAGARRARRSFRFCVTASVLLAVMLWFSERYLRFELTESQYIAALTLRTESARAILRNVVKRDAAEHESPTPKYLEALAEREEEDNVLPSYDKAYKLDPTDVFLVIRYGCALFRAGRYAEAQQRFREAALLPTENALPKYLEAAAMAFSEPANGDLTASLALLAQANTGNNPVEFPAPLWSGELPARGVWYNKLRRQSADECCAPLYKYAELVLSQAKHQIELRRVQYWDSWLSTLETMGRRLTVGNEIGAIQATAGIRIQLDAVEQREAIARIEPGGRDSEAAAALAARRQKLSEALAKLDQFESRRDQRIAAARPIYTLPLELSWKTVAMAFLIYFFTWVVGKLLRTDRTARALPHAPAGVWMLTGVSAAFFLLLCAMSLAQPFGVQVPEAKLLCYAVMAVAFLFGMVYPKLALNKIAAATPASTAPPDLPEDAARSQVARSQVELGNERYSTSAGDSGKATASGGSAPDTRGGTEANHPSRRWLMQAYASYWRRYYGTLLGLLLCVISVWIILYRVVFSIYPFQVELLTPGLETQELEVVKQALSMLG